MSGARSPDNHTRPHAPSRVTKSMYNEQLSFPLGPPTGHRACGKWAGIHLLREELRHTLIYLRFRDLVR